ncbi:YbaK/EbsC family protein [Enterococcus sp. LJL120]
MTILPAADIYQRLKKLEIAYQVIQHKAVYTVADIDFEIPASAVKNLLLKGKGKNNPHYYLVVMPDSIQLDLKKLALFLNETRLSFVSAEDLAKKFGLQMGAVGPLALPEKRGEGSSSIKVLLHQDIPRNQKIGFHPNQNDATVILDYADFLKYLAVLHYQPIYFSGEDTHDK